MKRIYTAIIVTAIFLIGTTDAFSVEKKDIKQVIKITKTLKKLSDKNKVDEIGKYFSDNYRSFDGYNKNEMIKIFEASSKLYPSSKTKEIITKIEPVGDNIKIYLEEVSKTNMDVNGKNAIYALNQEIKGLMTSKSVYSMLFAKEDGGWRIISDEIYDESTQILYGEAMSTEFSFETPKDITKGQEFSAKLTVTPPEHRYMVGSIGHDKIVWPPEKYFDPYRSMNNGVLERIMIANKEGKNEYANSTFAFIAPYVDAGEYKTEEDIKKAAISGMGVLVKRLNVKKEN